jgi:predicted phosphate transport protein (TIGR00153 family)
MLYFVERRYPTMFRITAKEEIFFDYFIETCEIICKAANLLDDLTHNYINVNEKIMSIEEAEHACDSYVHKILNELNKSFITPIDREDIFTIAKELDNITDDIESAAHRFSMFNVKEVRPEALTLTKLIVKATGELRNVMIEVKNMKKSKQLQNKIIEVNNVEDEADTIFRDAMASLFMSETDAVEVIKWKAIFELLENTIDACEDVANIVEGVVMKNA